MSFRIEKVNGGYKVVNSHTGKVHSVHTTQVKADAQVKLLNATIFKTQKVRRTRC